MKKNKKIVDAFGSEVMDAFRGEDEVFEIVERDDGFIDASPAKDRYFTEYKDWSEIEKKGIALARGRVLDVGCGAGRHSTYLQKKGFDVTGIDVSPLAIKVCQLRGLKKTKVLSIDDIDIFKPNAFDSVIMFGNNFGLFQGPKKFKAILKKFEKILSEKGVIIAITTDPYKTKNPIHTAYHKLNLRRGRMGGQLKIRLRYKKLVTPYFDYLFVSQKELRELLKETEWKIKKLIGSQKPSYVVILERS